MKKFICYYEATLEPERRNITVEAESRDQVEEIFNQQELGEDEEDREFKFCKEIPADPDDVNQMKMDFE